MARQITIHDLMDRLVLNVQMSDMVHLVEAPEA